MSLEHDRQNNPWPLLERLSKNEITDLVQAYLQYASSMKHIYWSMLVFMVLVLGYNLFLGGNGHGYAEAREIQNTFATVLIIFLLGFLVVAANIIGQSITVRKEVGKTAAKHHLDKEAVRKEFHGFVKATLGGPGLK
ncbi:hypothetical protein [Maribacter sp. 2307ULW6-5]|uniref:hypothetical protein n=1 Tax=Maribacter sp. 2307ULW6-5 TaxID=3386275 RepID=UPI0039BD5C3B